MEVFGFSILSSVLGLLGGGWLALKFLAPKTKWEWDDRIVDIIEGEAETLGVDPDELAKKSTGRLKKTIIKKAS